MTGRGESRSSPTGTPGTRLNFAPYLNELCSLSLCPFMNNMLLIELVYHESSIQVLSNRDRILVCFSLCSCGIFIPSGLLVGTK